MPQDSAYWHTIKRQNTIPMAMLQTVRPLATHAKAQAREIERDHTIIAFPHFWQTPAATEKTAHDALRAMPQMLAGMRYLAFPWATLIDAMHTNAHTTPVMLHALQRLADACDEHRTHGHHPQPPCATVCQHIHAMNHIDMFRAAGVTDLFWSHARTDQAPTPGIRIHPFPLFPAQAPTYAPANDQANQPATQPATEPASARASARASAPAREPTRAYLANFIGAYSPALYLSNVRQIIFNDANLHNDMHIIRRDRWHFDRAVYDEQVRGISAQTAQLAAEARMTKEYLDAIRASWFTLCPTGSGPNSIRIFEALALGSIPIILTKTLVLPGHHPAWTRAAIIEADTEQGYRRALDTARKLPIREREHMLKYGAQLFQDVGPAGFGDIIIDTLLSIHRW